MTPVLAVYLLQKRNRSVAAWAVVFAAPAALAAWQIFEFATGGILPAAMLAGYMRSYGLQAGSNKLRSVAALIVHAGWILSPLLVVFLAWTEMALDRCRHGCGRRGAIRSQSAVLAFLRLWNISAGLLRRPRFSECLDRHFLSGRRHRILRRIGALSAPIAAPVAILATRLAPPRILAAGFVLQIMLALALAIVNYQHWDAYRRFAASLHPAGRVWINAEWGLRYYLESAGGLPLAKDQAMRAGDTLVTSALALPLPVKAQIAPLSEMEIRPAIPLRIVSLDGRSAYSSAAGRELLPFEISTGPIDRVRAGVVIERQPQLTSINPRDPQSASQIISGLFEDGWMTEDATVILKRPDRGGMLRADIYIPDRAPARRLTMLIDGQQAAQETFARPGAYTLAVPSREGPATVTVTLKVDQTFSVPGDLRKLGVVVTSLGFRP